MSPALPSPARIRTWAGEPLHERHILAVIDILDDTQTTLDDWTLATSSYRGWADSAERTELERGAVWIGESYRPGKTKRRVFFMVPKK